ncbi:type II toxin-antitoxin system RelB/DinJ family antitoxin [Pectobacterium versatile]|uniref:type II toxin-antitoxin system RelB/DinJ family antitoxin n=1 Tax=Pectobacterium versatile TaxID=2488639 RepID=UPI002B2429E6|nr:type II toxin-antitoxin system RelB/DinJ family antitoxin [Pectobacterium versatile]
MSNVTFRIDDDLKRRSYAALKKLGITPTEALRLTLQYVAENERLPFKQKLLNDEDVELVEVVRKRLRNPKLVRMTLNDL